MTAFCIVVKLVHSKTISYAGALHQVTIYIVRLHACVTRNQSGRFFAYVSLPYIIFHCLAMQSNL